jgi:CBS domain-containing protein
MRVEDVMTREVVTVPPGASLKDAARLLVEHRISGLPVVDNQHHVLGVISETDVLAREADESLLPRPLAWLAGFDAGVDRSKLEARLVGAAMTTPAVTIEAHRPVGVAATRMIDRGVNRLPVVEDGKLVGIVTRADLVRAFVRSDAEIAKEIREDLVASRLRLDEHSVRVEVEDGEVTLTGTLHDRADAPWLEALVSKVTGVVGVHSKLDWTDDDTEG